MIKQNGDSYVFKQSHDDASVAYVAVFKDGARTGKVSQNIVINELVPGLKGPTVVLDLDVDGQLIGIELVGD